MSRITDIGQKRIRTEDEMRKALQDFIDGKHRLHIPPDDEDADIVIGDCIQELLALRTESQLKHICQICGNEDV